MITVEDVYKIRDQQDVDLSDLSKYLKDIISNIEDELTSKLHVNYNKHFSQHSNGRTNNWRFRKNHKFMDKYSSQDKVLMNINCNIIIASFPRGSGGKCVINCLGLRTVQLLCIMN